MPYSLWTQDELIATLQDDRFAKIPTFARSNFFKKQHYSGHEEIRFDELPPSYRYLAPFVHPLDRGKPIGYEQGQSARWFKPGYIKVKDSINAKMLVKPEIVEYFRGAKQLSPQDRYDRVVARWIDQHVRAIRMREEHMAFDAVLRAKVQIDYAHEQGSSWPSVEVDFGRAPGHTVVKNSGYWDNVGTSILSDFQTWANTMNNADRGGFPTITYVGSAVAPVFTRNTELKELLNTQYTGGQGTSFGRGLQRVDPTGLSYIGTLPMGIEIWCYNESYHNAAGAAVPFLPPKEILMVAAGYEGIEAHGLIYDMDVLSGAQAVSADIYPSMWSDPDKDNPRHWIMHQAAPLYIPMHPNKSFRAQVLA